METILFKMESVAGVRSNPPEITTFTLAQPCYITRVWTYHHGAVIGSSTPTIAFKNTKTGALAGPWPQVGYQTFPMAAGATASDPRNVPGPPDNYWVAYPGAAVPAGTYQVIDSAPQSWSYTADLGNRGVTWVYGWVGSGPAPGTTDAGVGTDGGLDGGELPTIISVPASLSPAAGLSAADFHAYGTSASETAVTIGSNGNFAADVAAGNTGIAFAVLTAGTASAAKLPTGTGLYMMPSLGTARIVLNGGKYTLATTGRAVMDATTSVLSILLMHPALAHPSLDVSTRETEWLLDRMLSGWPCLTTAATAYDADLLSGVALSTDATFTAAFGACLSDAATLMPEYLPPAPSQAELELSEGSAIRPAILRQQPSKLASAVIRKGADNKVAKLSVTPTSTGIIVQPKTVTNTAVDYYFETSAVAPSLTPNGPDSPIFMSPDPNTPHETVPPLLDSGFVAASSYAAYIDVFGAVQKKVVEVIFSTVQPGERPVLPAPNFYELRMFSGGWNGDIATFPQYERALIENLAMAALTMVSLVPCVKDYTKDDMFRTVLVEVVTKAQAQADRIAAKRSDMTVADLKVMVHTIAKATLDKFASEARKKGMKKGLEWLVEGGADLMGLVLAELTVVGKSAEFIHRLARLAEPYSFMEYFIVDAVPNGPSKSCVRPPSSYHMCAENPNACAETESVCLNGDCVDCVSDSNCSNRNYQTACSPGHRCATPCKDSSVCTVSGERVCMNGLCGCLTDAECNAWMPGWVCRSSTVQPDAGVPDAAPDVPRDTRAPDAGTADGGDDSLPDAATTTDSRADSATFPYNRVSVLVSVEGAVKYTSSTGVATFSVGADCSYSAISGPTLCDGNATVTVSLSPDQSRVDGFTLTRDKDLYGSMGYIYHFDVAGSAVPRSSTVSAGAILYGATGTQACTALTKFTATKTSACVAEAPDMVGYSCNASSSTQIIFSQGH